MQSDLIEKRPVATGYPVSFLRFQPESCGIFLPLPIAPMANEKLYFSHWRIVDVVVFINNTLLWNGHFWRIGI